jgi:hypothetical protein
VVEKLDRQAGADWGEPGRPRWRWGGSGLLSKEDGELHSCPRILLGLKTNFFAAPRLKQEAENLAFKLIDQFSSLLND